MKRNSIFSKTTGMFLIISALVISTSQAGLSEVTQAFATYQAEQKAIKGDAVYKSTKLVMKDLKRALKKYSYKDTNELQRLADLIQPAHKKVTKKIREWISKPTSKFTFDGTTIHTTVPTDILRAAQMLTVKYYILILQKGNYVSFRAAKQRTKAAVGDFVRQEKIISLHAYDVITAGQQVDKKIRYWVEKVLTQQQ